MSYKEGDKPDIKLPFEGERIDIGTWVYRHRVGLYVTIIGYLLIAIGFVTVKISMEINPLAHNIAIDLQELADLERQRDELQRSVEMLQQLGAEQMDEVQNRASNESANEQQSQRSQSNQANQNDQMSETDRLLKESAEKMRQMEQNRANYENGVAEAQAIKNRKSGGDSGTDQERRDSKVRGNVTVAYSFTDPVRHAQRLIVPAYQCEGGGEVIVNVTLNRNGDVTAAKIASGGDLCMQQTALSAAQASKFNLDSSAPAKHTGQISYIFIAQ